MIPHFNITFHPIGELGGAEERLLLETGPAHAGTSCTRWYTLHSQAQEPGWEGRN